MDSGDCDPQLSEARRMQREEEDAPWPSADHSLNEDRSGRVAGASEEDMKILEANLRLRLHEWGPLLTAGQRLLVWERPLPSLLTAAALHATFWVFSYLSVRPVFLLSLFLLCLLAVQRWKPWLLSHFQGGCHWVMSTDIWTKIEEDVEVVSRDVQPRGDPSSDSEGLSVVGGGGHHRLLSVPELCHYLAESWLTSHQYIQEVLLYKKHNPGKFCAAVCSGCAVLTVLGYYVPGIMISYIILLSVLLWPLVVYRELIQRMYTALEPVLMKLDYSMKGEALHRSHKKRQLKKEPDEGEEIVAETDSESEIELPGFSPELDVRITALALSITDSELSDEEASILESGGFSVSRATTPQLTDVSEDLDQPGAGSEEPTNSPSWVGGKSLQEEARSLPSQPLTLNPEELVPSLASPLHFVNTHFNGKGQPPALVRELHPLSEEIANRTVSTTLQSPITPLPALGLTTPETQEPGGDVEDFELLEQGELDLMREEFKEAEQLLSTTSSSSTPASTESELEKPSS